MTLYFSLVLVLSLACCCVSGQTSLSASEKQEILDAHNFFRARVNPVATNMEKMVWNDELASLAQNYAGQCIFDHNQLRSNQQSSFSYVGENLAISSSPRANYTRQIQGWNDEVVFYDYSANQCSDVCGHYTQVVWATSNNVGCGVYRCPNAIPGFPYPNGLILVCNYGPGGNINNRRPYLTGAQSCSACPSEQTFCVANQCSTTAGTGNTGSSAARSGPHSLFIISFVALYVMFIQYL